MDGVSRSAGWALPDPRWDGGKLRAEEAALTALADAARLDPPVRMRIADHAARLVERIRSQARPGLMDVFLAEYGLSTKEGIALMCLAEALLRVPDAATMDALIEDKIAPSDWGRHLGHSASPLVNASTWALMLTGKVLEDEPPGIAGTLRGMMRRMGEPVIRTAVGRAMREMGRQFVLGQDIDAAMARAAKGKEAEGFTYSYDMLGEAAMTARDAQRYAGAYAEAIDRIARACASGDVAANPGISVKLSALHPRYEVAKTGRVMEELVPVLRGLARRAAKAGMGLNVDAEEADRLGLSLEVIGAVLPDPELAGWDGFGVVVQAYGRRAPDVIAGLHDLAEGLDRRIMVRLVKGAYWDTEVKRAQVEGLPDFPVFTRKAATDVSYLGCARMLLDRRGRIYPQFATHNAHTVAAVLEMAGGTEGYEFQRLHGMGETLHDIVRRETGARCRIYAPVGAHRDLLAYLVRRLLENGANSSFVNRVVDRDVPAADVVADPLAVLVTAAESDESTVRKGLDLFAPERRNSRGFDLSDARELRRIETARPHLAPFAVGPIIVGEAEGGAPRTVRNPATGETIGKMTDATARDVETALAAARPWEMPAAERAGALNRAADLFEQDHAEVFALLATEAGKCLPDAVAELREAVDFLRYYAAGAEALDAPARGLFACISPWNFPLAIFSGQVAAALAAGNGVLAKPAEATPAIAAWAVARLHAAGVPRAALQLLPGEGGTVGAALVSDPRVDGVAFTGSTATARRIQRAMADHLSPGAPLIAETGGLNAMIVDSTALPEQAVRDIVASAFRSAGQRCSALRCLYVQEDVADGISEMLCGAMDELSLGDPWDLATDIGPVITAEAKRDIDGHVAQAGAEGRLVHRLRAPEAGSFVAPALIRVGGIGDLDREVFGPVLHMATFRAADFDRVIAEVNATGYGLTFGLHTRIDERVQTVADAVHAGNVYANRNQIGAVVGSQPFGGEGLSGTGPKAGGPHYLPRFTRRDAPGATGRSGNDADPRRIATLLADAEAAPAAVSDLLPGPTGELNRLALHPRCPLLCLGPGRATARMQAEAVRALGGHAIEADGLAPAALTGLPAFGGAFWWGGGEGGRAIARALAAREGPIVPLVTGMPDMAHAHHERHLCVDTTAAGGNAALLSGAADG